MRTKTILTAVLSIFLLTAQDGMPLRPHGRFNAEATGAISGPITGDVSAEIQRDGSMRLYFGQDSSQMMKTDRLLTVTIAAPQGKGKRTLTLAKDKVSLMLQNLTTLERTVATADGTLALEGRDLLTGSFALKATLGNRPLTLKGKFEKAPVVTALD
jgi:hypothetical protein